MCLSPWMKKKKYHLEDFFMFKGVKSWLEKERLKEARCMVNRELSQVNVEINAHNNQGFGNGHAHNFENWYTKTTYNNPFENHPPFSNNGNNTPLRTPRSHIEGYTSPSRWSQHSHHGRRVDNEVNNEDLINFQQDKYPRQCTLESVTL